MIKNGIQTDTIIELLSRANNLVKLGPKYWPIFLLHLFDSDTQGVKIRGLARGHLGVRRWMWVFSSVGRATALQAVGRRFDPCNTHQLLFDSDSVQAEGITYGAVVQLVRPEATHRERRARPEGARRVRTARIAVFE